MSREGVFTAPRSLFKLRELKNLRHLLWSFRCLKGRQPKIVAMNKLISVVGLLSLLQISLAGELNNFYWFKYDFLLRA